MSECVADSQTEITIVHFPDGWRMLAEGRRWGRFNYRVDAEEAALRLAQKLRAEGRDARVTVQSLTGELNLLKIA